MQTIQFNSKISLDFQTILQGFSELPISDLEHLVGELNQIVEQRKKASSEYKAQFLINKIKHGGPSKEFHDELRILATKSLQGKITAEQHEELLKMIPVSENWAVKRLEHMIELSNIWEVTVDEVMKRLDIKAPESIHA